MLAPIAPCGGAVTRYGDGAARVHQSHRLSCRTRPCPQHYLSPVTKTGKCQWHSPLVQHATEVATTETLQHSMQQENSHAARQQQQPEVSKSTSTFAWTKQWYPVTSIDNLEPKEPTNVKLLGKSLVVWNDGKGNWHCLEDRCSHRLAPLSEGRIKDGELMCSYHGWQFDVQGKCTKIPQIDDPKAHSFACSQHSSAVNAYPTKVRDGLLWLWPEPGLEGLQESASTPIRNGYPDPSAPDDGSWQYAAKWFVRDLPLRFDTVLENFLDPSHVPFAHHKVMGNRDKPLQFSYSRETPITESGFLVQLKALAPQQTPPQQADKGKAEGSPAPPAPAMQVALSFHPPMLVRYKSNAFANDLMAVPTEPGWTRVYITSLSPKDNPNAAKRPLAIQLASFIMRSMMKFGALDHSLFRNAILDGDSYMLHVAERELLKGGNNWKKDYFMPASADMPIVALRRWFQDHAGDIPTCSPSDVMPPTMSKEAVLDRYQQHTRHCGHCKKALKQINVALGVSIATAVLAAIMGVAKAMTGPLLQPATLAPLAVAALCSLLSAAFLNFRKHFFYQEYVHAHRD